MCIVNTIAWKLLLAFIKVFHILDLGYLKNAVLFIFWEFHLNILHEKKLEEASVIETEIRHVHIVCVCYYLRDWVVLVLYDDVHSKLEVIEADHVALVVLFVWIAESFKNSRNILA